MPGPGLSPAAPAAPLFSFFFFVGIGRFFGLLQPLQRHIRLLSIPDGRTRLEAFLRQEARKTGEIVCAGMTREQMARYLGMNRSALSRLLGSMQREGRIELRRGNIRITQNDWEA